MTLLEDILPSEDAGDDEVATLQIDEELHKLIMTYNQKPIMSEALEEQVLNAVVMFQHRKKWKQWGLDKIRKQGAAVLLVGPPGTGKTVIAEYLALKIRRKGIIRLSFADFGSGDPGEMSRRIRETFDDGRKRGGMTIYMDECDAILIDRDALGSDLQWMMEVIDELLIQIDSYEYLVMLSTNRPQVLDKALSRRLIATIQVDPPEFPERVKLWRQKMPDPHPLKLSPQEVERLATLQITGNDIERAIMNASSTWIRLDKQPNFKDLLAAAKTYSKQQS